jgi:serine/threonine-protein kinase
MPARFGKYTLLRKLAVGGMAELFLALQRSVAGFEKLIVVKRVLPHLAKDSSFIEMLLAEARIAATLNHPNVGHIYDVGSVDGQFYIAMEHIHGEDLRSLVRQMRQMNVTTFPVEHALAIALGCCAGLAYAHDKRDLDGEPMGIVHRDVSPQNVLVTFTGDVKLVDFGIAKAGRGQVEDTGSGQLKGKVPYMSPEQARGEVLDNRSDIFSLGIMLFELCTGRRLFRGKNEMETLRKIVEEEYPRPRELNPSLSPRLEEIILRALEKSPERRYQSARDMQVDLEDLIRAEQLKVSPVSLGAWMADLFRDQLAEQKQILQEGRQLAEAIASQVAEEEREGSLGTGGQRSGVRAKPSSRMPSLLLGLVLLAVAAAGAFVLARPTEQVATSRGMRGEGVIRLASTPSGAAIWIDGERRPQSTPASIEGLMLGARYSVKLTREGFAPHTEMVELRPGQPRASLNVTLARPSASNFAVIRVRTTPAGARVLLDGRDTTQVTPATVPEVTPGEAHTLALMLDGYATRNESLTFEAGQVADLSFALEPLPLGPTESMLRVTTDPPNAALTVNGTAYSTGSPYALRMPTANVRVSIAAEGFETAEREVALVGGQESALSVTLERERRRLAGATTEPATSTGPATSGAPGRLTFSATPWCNVTIDGRSAGDTPVVNYELAPGRHTIVCDNPEAGTRRLSVTVGPGETVRRSITF